MLRLLAKNARKQKILSINLAVSIKSCTFAAAFKQIEVDPLAQLVEHNTFNVGVLGSSPKRITKINPQVVLETSCGFFYCPK